MPQTKDMLPIDVANESTEGGTITYANEVIAIISGIAASEIEGIAGMVTSGGFGDIIGKNRNITRGVKVEVGTQEVSVDLYTMVEYGQPIQKVASQVQENVRKSIEAMTGLKVVRVDVHVQGVSFEKEKREVQSNLESANVPNLPGARKKGGKAAAKPSEPKVSKAEAPKEKAQKEDAPKDEAQKDEALKAEEPKADEKKAAEDKAVEAKATEAKVEEAVKPIVEEPKPAAEPVPEVTAKPVAEKPVVEQPEAKAEPASASAHDKAKPAVPPKPKTPRKPRKV